MLITPTSLTINQLLGSGNEQYVIPSYQRRYSWHERQVRELVEDTREAREAGEGARYCLEQIELSNHGAHAELEVLGPDEVHVEHIIPQKIKTQKAKEEFGDWVSYLGDQADALHPKYVSRIGNLTIFSGTLNISASNNPFERKKKAYKKSGIMMTSDLATMPQFKFKNVDQRSKDLADSAVRLWPRP